MDKKLSGILMLGYTVLFISLFTTAIRVVGWVTASTEEMITFELVFNLLLVLAGFFALWNGEKLEGILFLVIGAYWFSHGLRMLWYPALQANTMPASYDGWFALVVAAVLFDLWLSAAGGSMLHKFFLLGLWIAYLLGAVANWISSSALIMILGYIVLIDSLLAGLYCASIDRGKASMS
ncbi:MAG: hypothetical protein KGJ59_05510 [Bacteroidota bacterium]|nr:hypothetical protein [Bacteroidota bacterium]